MVVADREAADPHGDCGPTIKTIATGLFHATNSFCHKEGCNCWPDLKPKAGSGIISV